jgi:hypothetical protein
MFTQMADYPRRHAGRNPGQLAATAAPASVNDPQHVIL